MRRPPPEECPNCGAPVPRQARACPECGADEQTAWAEGEIETGSGLPDEEFDYDRFVEREFGHGPKPKGIGWVWWLAALLLLAALLFAWFR